METKVDREMQSMMLERNKMLHIEAIIGNQFIERTEEQNRMKDCLLVRNFKMES